MLTKFIFLLSASIALAESAKLLRKPKVYNAVITTDENLTPSRAYPIIQPVIQPAYPVLSPFYPAVYDPYGQSQSRNDFNSENNGLKNEQPIERKSDEPLPVEEQSNNDAPNQEPQPQRPPLPQNNQPEEKPEGDKSPIPLNEYGFPPSLIPLQKYPAYPYGGYPFIFDSYGNFQAVQQFPVIPPSYYPRGDHNLPPIEQPMFAVGARKLEPEPSREEKSLPSDNSLPAVSSDAIKNNGNKNVDIPDVEIPPIPFSIKKN